MVRNERIDERLPLEERVRRMGGERSFAIGLAIGDTLLRFAHAVSAHPRHAPKAAAPIGERVAAGD